jgi:hypothetical protein
LIASPRPIPPPARRTPHAQSHASRRTRYVLLESRKQAIGGFHVCADVPACVVPSASYLRREGSTCGDVQARECAAGVGGANATEPCVQTTQTPQLPRHGRCGFGISSLISSWGSHVAGKPTLSVRSACTTQPNSLVYNLQRKPVPTRNQVSRRPMHACRRTDGSQRTPLHGRGLRWALSPSSRCIDTIPPHALSLNHSRGREEVPPRLVFGSQTAGSVRTCRELEAANHLP